ncbi:MAG: CBS domain-containing protein [Rhizomicrobium sp.]
MKIIDVLNKKERAVRKVPAYETLRVVIDQPVHHRVGSLVVTAPDNTPIGLITERSVIETLARTGRGTIDGTARAMMPFPLPSCRPDDNVRNAMSLMTSQRTRHLIVVDSGETIGIVSLGDLVKCKLQDPELENLVLREMVGVSELLSGPDRRG